MINHIHITHHKITGLSPVSNQAAGGPLSMIDLRHRHVKDGEDNEDASRARSGGLRLHAAA